MSCIPLKVIKTGRSEMKSRRIFSTWTLFTLRFIKNFGIFSVVLRHFLVIWKCRKVFKRSSNTITHITPSPQAFMMLFFLIFSYVVVVAIKFRFQIYGTFMRSISGALNSLSDHFFRNCAKVSCPAYIENVRKLNNALVWTTSVNVNRHLITLKAYLSCSNKVDSMSKNCGGSSWEK